MNPIKNPFSPGAGAPPPELVGRENILQQATVLIGRIKERRPEKSLMLTGLRGVGKTVLLNRIERQAREEGYKTVYLEAREDRTLGQVLAPELKRVLFELDAKAKAKEKVRRAMLALKNFVGNFSVNFGGLSIELEPFHGLADSGDIESDLTMLLLAVAEAAEGQEEAIALFVDEIQYFSEEEFSALIMAMHRIQQKALPMFLVGAGLPILPALAGNSKSYAERLFAFPRIDALNKEEARHALLSPLDKNNVGITPDAFEQIFNYTRGYPYFLQEWGYQIWNQTEEPPISFSVVEKASETVIKRLDENFFRVRFDRLTGNEKKFLGAMAMAAMSSPSRRVRISDIAVNMGQKKSTLAPVRASLIKKGMIYSPAYGEMDFTVPLFADFMIRMIPPLQKDN